MNTAFLTALKAFIEAQTAAGTLEGGVARVTADSVTVLFVLPEQTSRDPDAALN